MTGDTFNQIKPYINTSTTIPKAYSNNTFSRTQTFANASTTNISSSYASSTSGFFGSLTIGSLNGFLKATAGAISSALIDLTSNVTGILPVANGGTGWASLAAGTVPYGNGSSALATTSPGTSGQVLALLNGIPTWVATTTLSTISGTLGVGNGGTGATSFSYGLLLSPGGSNAITNIATSSLGLLTPNVAEGSNLYYTDARVQSFVHSSTTISKTYSSNTFTANQKICIGATCVTEAQLKALIATAAGASSPGGNEAPALAHPAVAGTQGTTTSSTSAILVVNGNNPAQWEVGQPWQDNLGALFTHDGQSETIYSTSTIDTTQTGTTTIDYWAAVLATATTQWLHATRVVVVNAPANDNTPTASSTLAFPSSTVPVISVANDNTPLAPLSATGTDPNPATSTPPERMFPKHEFFRSLLLALVLSYLSSSSSDTWLCSLPMCSRR